MKYLKHDASEDLEQRGINIESTYPDPERICDDVVALESVTSPPAERGTSLKPSNGSHSMVCGLAGAECDIVTGPDRPWRVRTDSFPAVRLRGASTSHIPMTSTGFDNLARLSSKNGDLVAGAP